MIMDYVKHSVLSQCGLFTGAESENILLLSKNTHLEHFEKDTEVVRQGERNSDIGVLADGELEINYRTHQDQVLPIAKIKPLEWFGESAFSTNNSLVSAKTTENSSVIFISTSVLFEAMNTDEVIMNNVMMCLSDRVFAISRFALSHIDNDTLSKIGKQILNQVEMFSSYESPPECIELRLTKTHLAALIGQTRQSISPYLNKYIELGLLSFGYGTIKINNINRLRAYVGEVC
ncbi:MAG TPA: Crp/Fnr family transcriptional regulator [Vibrio sp.]|uniref:Crp/Fnr family transcriptional regulator n=1 Tax=Vibrio TaxID=662 RepID=UPI000485E8B1|nr:MULTISPECIES: Crp/Fnr family transcriptional regulator [Vibrio]HCH02832.1 Crp/Fnr family transcriptional regulator [Vibrio sp.]